MVRLKHVRRSGCRHDQACSTAAIIALQLAARLYVPRRVGILGQGERVSAIACSVACGRFDQVPSQSLQALRLVLKDLLILLVSHAGVRLGPAVWASMSSGSMGVCVGSRNADVHLVLRAGGPLARLGLQ